MGIVTLPTDEELANRAAAGDRQAFESLVRRYTGGLFALCRRFLGDDGEAEDRVQDAFLRAYQNLHRYDPTYKFSSWLFRIGQNLCIDTLRRRKAWLPLSPQEPAEAEQPISAAETDEQAAALETAIAGLQAKYRAVLHHKYALGLNANEIAKELDMTPVNVRVCLHRAIKTLRGKLAAND